MTSPINTRFCLAALLLALSHSLAVRSQPTGSTVNIRTVQPTMSASALKNQTQRLAAFNMAPAKLEPAKPKETFNVVLFDKLLTQGLAGKSVGLSYAVATDQGMKTIGGLGYFRTAADAPAEKATAFIPLYVASMNKTITATALIKLLDEKKVSVDSPIWHWLPLNWKRGPGIDQITFRQLLTHQTRFTSKTWWEYFPDLRDVIAAGATDPDIVYRNTNFNLMRVIIACMNGFLPGSDDQKNSEETARLYRDYVQQAVLSKCLLKPDYKADPTDAPALNYPMPDAGKKGILSADLTLNCGAQGIRLSALDYTKFLTYLLKTDNILTAAQRQRMLDGQFGLFAADTPRGKMYQHGGYMPEAGNGGGFSGAWYVFPGDIRVVVLCNSEFKGDLTGIISSCYNQSWKTNQ